MSGNELEQVKPIVEYLKVLIDSYPKPISQTELARRSNVTKSAISKVRTKLLGFCDQRIGFFDRKLLLKDDTETSSKLLNLFGAEWRFNDFLQSSYAKSIIQKLNIHGRLVEAFKELSYEYYFSKDDTDIIVNIVLNNISSLKFSEEFKSYTKKLSKYKESSRSIFPVMYIFSEAFSKFDVAAFESEAELLNLLRLRDKFYSFVLDNSEKILRKWDFVISKKIEEQDIYINVYKETITYFLLKYMQDFTNKIRQKAKEKKLDFREEYGTIGALWKKEPS